MFRVTRLKQCGAYPYAKYKKYVYSTYHQMGIHDSSLSDRPTLADIHDSANRINENENKPEVINANKKSREVVCMCVTFYFPLSIINLQHVNLIISSHAHVNLIDAARSRPLQSAIF